MTDRRIVFNDENMKKSLLTILGVALILSVFSLSVSASELQETTIIEIQADNSLSTQVNNISSTTFNPNQIEEVQYLLSYNNNTGVQTSRKLEPNENIEIDAITPQAQGGVVYSVILVPIEGSKKIDIMYRINGFIGEKPNRIDLDFTLFRGLERGTTGTSLGACTAIIQGILNVKVRKEVHVQKASLIQDSILDK